MLHNFEINGWNSIDVTVLKFAAPLSIWLWKKKCISFQVKMKTLLLNVARSTNNFMPIVMFSVLHTINLWKFVVVFELSVLDKLCMCVRQGWIWAGGNIDMHLRLVWWQKAPPLYACGKCEQEAGVLAL